MRITNPYAMILQSAVGLEQKGGGVKRALIDTNIVSMFLRGHPEVKARTLKYVSTLGPPFLSVITRYEILSGLAHRDAHRQLRRFQEFSQVCIVCPLTEDVVQTAARIYAQQRKKGKPIDDLDILIAATAMANGLVVVTRNRKHFDRIEGLAVEDWSEP